MYVSEEVTLDTQIKVQQFLLQKRKLIVESGIYEGLDNYTFGDAYIETTNGTDKKRCNIDYKKQTRNDPDHIFIELIQVSKTGKKDSWLYNNNIHLVVYENKKGDTYCIPKALLQSIARTYNTDEYWNKCIVYTKMHEDRFEEERAWINTRLQQCDTSPCPIVATDSYVQGAFNYSYGEKYHSGFCLAVHTDHLQRCKL